MTRRWVVLGAGGMLGVDVVELLRRRGLEVVAAARGDVDVAVPGQVAEAVAGAAVVVNCAAWTAVDDAEQQEAAAFAVNARGAAVVAREAAAAGARLVHVSTDYVFDGTAHEPYPEDALPAPRSAYGRTKAAGEWAVRASCPDALVVRTAWLYGRHGGCFPRTIARLLAQRDTVSVVDDQVGSPTWTVDVAGQVLDLVTAGAPAGAYAATSAGRASWWEFARAVAVSLGLDPGRVAATDTAHFPRPAPRPAFSVLATGATSAAGVEPIGDWRSRWAAAAPEVLAADAGAR
ncbi:dTDP-4-dehydrorhamnose reductase [Kineococcus glutinatus]|uniref:dTDP-4-dehydrorhamnose reductase n=1 Tax=Kineococcus glutinatus TaxID=1070872 RepID=A0ABP9HZV0_9ACTN